MIKKGSARICPAPRKSILRHLGKAFSSVLPAQDKPMPFGIDFYVRQRISFGIDSYVRQREQLIFLRRR